MYTFSVDLAKRGELSHVGDMRRYRNNRYDYDAADYYCYQAVAALPDDDDNDDENSYFYYLGLLL